ncbi:recombination protein F [Clostridium perfringens]|uniref:ATP-dependent nuclease n=1 Tax=Clostridium perfringens TaxID=1502 RepID=UPI0024445060|nr:AAA family ATPase [Clostridium perfringens]MDG6880066.1 recombination protein F [Clostridium perfringens]
MHIDKIQSIKNYRNLSGEMIYFDKELNFFIGENNIGKTNILELINIILSQGSFKEDDFYEVCEPIEIKFTIAYNEYELGFFENNFDVEDAYSISIIAKQDSVDDRIRYFHDTPLESEISSKFIRRLNTLYYYAQRTPGKEIDFRKKQGSGRVLNYLIDYNLKKEGLEDGKILKIRNIDKVLKKVNKNIDNINSITGDRIKAYRKNNAKDILSGILGIGDGNNRDLTSLGQGIQYAFNILLQIMDVIYSVKISNKREDFEERLIYSGDKRFFPIFLILDEPEIHQHPYRQRSLIKKIHELIENKNVEFATLLKDLFEIDGLTGQIFMATHSPNILLDSYKQFIRIYIDKKEGDSPKILSGSNIQLDDGVYKHLLHNYIYLKEAMFSRFIVFVEGDTEFGSIPVLANRMQLDLDEKSIGIVKLDGADSVKKCLSLYKNFNIKSVAIIDGDKRDKYSGIEHVYFTNGNDFEEDIYDNFKLSDYLLCCKELGILDKYIGILKKRNIEFDVNKLKKNPLIIEIDDDLQKEIMINNRENELRFLKSSKNASKGSILSNYVTEIPSSYKKIISLLKKEV